MRGDMKEIVSGNDQLIVARDKLGRPQLFRQGEDPLDLDEALPFRDYPGHPSPRDPVKDAAVMTRLRQVGDGDVPKRGQVLDYEQSEALFNAANGHFQEEMPLMNTERWLARYVQDNDLTYTDHDGRRYKMRNGWRYPVSGAPTKNVDDETEDDDDENSDEDVYLV